MTHNISGTIRSYRDGVTIHQTGNNMGPPKLHVVISAVAMFVITAAAAQQPKPMPDWITATNQPCKLWNPEPEPDESVTWSGGCENGLASGKGVLRWTENGKADVIFAGEYRNGKRNGPGVLMTPDGQHVAGVWVDDKLLSGDGGAI